MALTQISTAGVKDDAVTAGKIPANAVGSSELADNAVTTAKIASDAVTQAKIANNAISSSQINTDAVVRSKIADEAVDADRLAASAVTTAKIADQAVDLTKLPHGTGSNDGKFLRANNGADPTFETVSGTTINNNADNRVITGSGTANTLNGESNVQINSSGIMTIGNDPSGAATLGGDLNVANTNGGTIVVGDTGSGEYLKLHGSGSGAYVGSKSNDPLIFFTNDIANERMRLDSSGKVGIGETTPLAQLHIKPASNITQLYLEQNNAAHGYSLLVDGPNGGHLKFMRHVDGSETQRALLRSDGGLCFGTDSATANALDDYEEGTWTPTMNDNNGSNVVLTGTGACIYTKIGRLVNISAQITLNDTGKSGQLFLTNLPFTGNSHAQLAAGSWWMDRAFGNDTAGGNIYKQGNDATLRFVNPTAVHTNAGGDDAAKSATRYLEFSQWQNGKHIYFNLTYMT